MDGWRVDKVVDFLVGISVDVFGRGSGGEWERGTNWWVSRGEFWRSSILEIVLVHLLSDLG